MKMTSAERDRAASHPSAPENIHPPGQFELSQKIAALTDLTAQQLREEWGLPESLHGAVQLSLTTINNRRDYRPFRGAETEKSYLPDGCRTSRRDRYRPQIVPLAIPQSPRLLGFWRPRSEFVGWSLYL
jgi:hypothetical protein